MFIYANMEIINPTNRNCDQITEFSFEKIIEYTFFSLEIINPQNVHKNILEISDQNRINIKVTFLYFSTNQLKTQNKNILEYPDQKLINRKFLGSKTNK